MITLLIKELSSFLSSLIGYIVIAVFLATIGLFMWVFPIDFNVFDQGYANIDGLFILGPWVFTFLAPAITMRSFAEEIRTGTIELLLTRPLSDWQIILAKFLAGFLLLIFALLPTLVYYYSVSQLAGPTGVDTGGMWGSYIGLLLLGASFVAIGTFASAMTENQIVSFILAVFLSFICYQGFESISVILDNNLLETIISNLGMSEHYHSMSRGVIDTRDMLYFLSLIGFFLLLAKTKLESRKW